MKIKTSEATGKALDWGLAQALELNPEISRPSPYDGSIAVLALPLPEGYPRHHKCGFFHTDPAVCMENIACEYGKVWKVEAIPRTTSPTALAMGFSVVGADVTKAYGKTLAEAVARCVIAMKLGDEFEVPDELCQIECWSCGHTMTMEQRSTNDGHCVKCNAEIEMPDELGVMS